MRGCHEHFTRSVLTRLSLPSTSFWFSVLVSVLILGGMVVCATSLVPLEWRVDGSAWAVIFPLAYVVFDLSRIYEAHLNYLVSSLAAISSFLCVPFCPDQVWDSSLLRFIDRPQSVVDDILLLSGTRWCCPCPLDIGTE